MSMVDKYVCFRNSDTGGFCCGRIKAEAQMNTLGGKQPALILTDVMTCQGLGLTLEHPRGDRMIQTRVLNLKTDVIDRSEAFGDMTAEDMFLMLMEGEVDTAKYSKNQKVIHDIVKNGGMASSDIRSEMDKRMDTRKVE